ncbi:MAG TPA: tetratricopeptide repeat protein [Pyrinomonadaceae bacterium]|nr:tetratricopeptide repeat protein [Pyrinomonadaceae bacterium]
MKKVLLLLLLLSLSVSAQTQTLDPVASLREQIQAASSAPEQNRLRLKLADLLLTSGHKSEAVAELQQMAGSSDFDPVGFYNLGNFFARLGESEAAVAAYRTAIEQRNGQYSRAYNNLGVVLLRAGRWDEAHDALLSALKLENFRYAEASYNLGRVYAARGQKDLAVREWRRALAVDPRHDAAAQALANALVNVGTEDRVVVKSPSAKAPHNAEPKKAAPTSAPSDAGSQLTLDQASFDYLQRARSASERGKMLEAVENYRRVLNREGGYFAPANLELSFALIGLKRQDEALANLLQVSQRDGARYPISYFHLGRIYESKGELKLAEAAFSRAASTYQPTNPQFLLDLSRVREKLGDFKGALDAMEQYLKLMQAQGQKPAWTDERLAELRSKARQN